MIVTRELFGPIVERLREAKILTLDTETTGLRPYHGSRLFSLIISATDIAGTIHSFYFNFQSYPGLDPQSVLLPSHLRGLEVLFADESKVWRIHEAKYDLAILAADGIEIAGTIHCTKAIERVVYNDYLPGTYDLENCAKRIGFEKDGTVEKFILDQKLWDWTPPEKPGDREKDMHYDRVPFDIIVPYGERDGEICHRVGDRQDQALQEIAKETNPDGKTNLPTVLNIAAIERRLTKTLFRMERVGVRVDLDYCVQASRYEADRAAKATEAYRRETGRDYKASAKDFAAVFESERDLWGITEKGNPSFDADCLARLKNPAAGCILALRDAKSRSDFFKGFLWYADKNGDVHPSWNQAGAATGRGSSSNPNFQNLTNEDEEENPSPFPVRRAVVPRPGFVFFMPDWDQMEYRCMFDYACRMWGSETEIVRKIKNEGLDPHQATADLVTAMGTPLTRRRAKNGNFAFLYGSGYDTLAATIGSSRKEAVELKDSIKGACPEIQNLIDNVTRTAKVRGFIRNWAGRRSYLRDHNFAYKMTNYLIQGGCADAHKITLNQIDESFASMRSRLVMTIHDEAPAEIHESEILTAPKLMVNYMETVYPHKYLPLTVGCSWSDKSLGDKKKGMPA